MVSATSRHQRELLIVALVCAALFIPLGVLIHAAPEKLVVIDTFGAQLAAPFQTEPWVGIFLAITFLGTATGIIFIGIVSAFFLRKHPSFPIRLATALISGTLFVEYLKVLFSRTRPDTLSWLITEPSFSFPSGHATASMTLYGYICYLMLRREKKRTAEILTIIASIVVILLIGFSRLVLGVHYLTDVIGGYLLGAFWLCISIALPLGRRYWKTSRRK